MRYPAAMLRALTLALALPFRLQATFPHPDPAAATIQRTSFHEATTNVTFQYPADFIASPPLTSMLERLQQAEASSSQNSALQRCLSFPLVTGTGLSGSGSSAHLGLLLLVRIDNTCVGWPVSADVLGVAAQQMSKVLAAFGAPLTEDAKSYQLDGHPAAFVQGSAESKQLGNGQRVHEATACVLIGGNTLCWVMLDTNFRLMPALVSSPVSIDGKPETPLIPKDLLEPW